MIEPSIEKFPRYRKFDIHMLVDFIELRCLVNPDKSMVTSDLKEIFTPEDEEVDQASVKRTRTVRMIWSHHKT